MQLCAKNDISNEAVDLFPPPDPYDKLKELTVGAERLTKRYHMFAIPSTEPGK